MIVESRNVDQLNATFRRYSRFRAKSTWRYRYIATLEFVVGIAFVYTFIAPLICR